MRSPDVSPTMRIPFAPDRRRRRRTALRPVAPLLAASLALVVLAGMPLWVSARVRALRDESVGVTERAHALVREVATATLLEAAERGDVAHAPDSLLEGRYALAVGTEMERESLLTALGGRVDPPTAAALRALRRATHRWQAVRSSASGDPSATTRLAELLDAAGAAEARLAARADGERRRVRALERWDTLLPVVLVPLALGCVVVLYRAGRRMTALAGEADRARAELQRASDAKLALLRGLTHDLKNLLWAASGYAALLREEILGPLSVSQREKIARIQHLIDGSARMLGDTLEIARADAGQLPVRRRRLEVRPLLHGWTADFRVRAEAAGLSLVAEVADDAPEVIHSDESHVGTILGNLLSNAIKYTPSGGRVHLRGSAGRRAPGGGAWLVVEVRDDGPGIPRAYLDRVFEEFFRAPTAEAAARGAGVGLAMSRRVARLLGGDVVVASEEGRGSCFALWLPVEPSEPRDGVAAPAPGDRAQLPRPSRPALVS